MARYTPSCTADGSAGLWRGPCKGRSAGSAGIGDRLVLVIDEVPYWREHACPTFDGNLAELVQHRRGFGLASAGWRLRYKRQLSAVGWLCSICRRIVGPQYRFQRPQLRHSGQGRRKRRRCGWATFSR